MHKSLEAPVRDFLEKRAALLAVDVFKHQRQALGYKQAAAEDAIEAIREVCDGRGEMASETSKNLQQVFVDAYLEQAQVFNILNV